MKKKAILASALALALMVSPLGGLRASAEEGGVSLAAETGTASNVIPLTNPTNARFTDEYNLAVDWSGAPSFTGGAFWWHIKVFKDDQLYKEYMGKGNGRTTGDAWTIPADGKTPTTPFTFPFYQVLEDSGTYHFEIRVEKSLSNGRYCASEWISSNEVTYSRPETTLETTVGYWDTEKEGVFYYESVEGASGYQYRLLKLDENSGQWTECSKMNQGVEGLWWDGSISFTYIKPGTSPDAAGQVKDRDFSYEIKANGPGRYCVAIKALSGNLNEIANGVEERSAVLETGNSNSGYDQAEDDSDQSDDISPLEEKVAAAAPGEVIRLQGITSLTNTDMKLLLKNGITLEMEYTYEGVDYKIRIPAGAAMDNDIPIYGPLYLSKYYSVANSGWTGMTGPTYTVQKGDTLSKIARANNMTVSELAAKNPQITNVNVIIQGQTIQIK